MKNLEIKVREYKEYARMIQELEALQENIKDELKEELKARETDEMDIDIFKVRWPLVPSNRIDITAFKNELPEIAARFTVKTESRRFSIV